MLHPDIYLIHKWERVNNIFSTSVVLKPLVQHELLLVVVQISPFMTLVMENVNHEKTSKNWKLILSLFQASSSKKAQKANTEKNWEPLLYFMLLYLIYALKLHVTKPMIFIDS